MSSPTSLRRQERRQIPPRVGTLAVILAVPLLWWLLTSTDMLNPKLFPSPIDFGNAFAQAAEHGLWRDMKVTIYELLLASVGFTIVGVVFGLILGSSEKAFKVFYEPISTLFAMPKITILPIFVVLLGVGAAQKISFGALYGVFPLIMSVMVGTRSVQRVHIQLFQSIGATQRMRAFLLVIPSMLPSFFEGLRIAYVYAGIGVLLAEMYVSVNGLGQSIINSANRSTLALFWVYIFAATVVFLVGATILRIAETRFSRWRA